MQRGKMPSYIKRLFSRSARKAAILEGTGLVMSVPDRKADKMTATQEAFLQWNAGRLGISLEESKLRYAASSAVLPGGHGGSEFGKFNGVAHEVFRVFFEDSATEVFDTYRYHGPMHFLVMLTYPEPKWAATDLIVRELSKRSEVSLLDFGCGLAQQSRTLAVYLRDQGIKVRLTLADIPTLRQEFLIWWGKHVAIPTTFLPCTRDTPIPELPECDLCQTTEFFEHVHDPVMYFDRFDAKLSHGGLLVTGVMDHHAAFMHVSPELGALRARIAERGYQTLVANRVLRKP
jgi:hypothetical protein